MKIGFISAALPPEPDAIGEHTWWLAREVASRGHEVVAFSTRTAALMPDRRARVVPCFDLVRPENRPGLSPSIGREHAAAPFDWLVLQFNPFAYGPRGYCPWLIEAVQRWKKLNSAPRLAVIFHEIFTDDPGLLPALIRQWQRPQSRRLAALADRVFVTCEAYGPPLGVPCEVLFAGSNLPEPAAYATALHPLRLGAFGTAHPSHRFDLMAAALRQVLAGGREAEFLFIGSGGDAAAEAFTGLPFRTTGFVSPAAASEALASLDLVLAPFSDGFSTRRGSTLAALQHARPLVSTAGPRTADFLRAQDGRAFRLASSDEAFGEIAATLAGDPAARTFLAAGGRAFFADHFSWPRLTDRLLTVLG